MPKSKKVAVKDEMSAATTAPEAKRRGRPKKVNSAPSAVAPVDVSPPEPTPAQEPVSPTQPKKRGRPKGIKTAPETITPPKKRGRPAGSKNKKKMGRPMGSKNAPKVGRPNRTTMPVSASSPLDEIQQIVRAEVARRLASALAKATEALEKALS